MNKHNKWFWIATDPDAEVWMISRIGSIITFYDKRIGWYISIQLFMFMFTYITWWRWRFNHLVGWYHLWKKEG